MLEPYEVEWLTQSGNEEAAGLPSEIAHQLYPEILTYGINGVQVVQLIDAIKADIIKSRLPTGKSDIMHSKARVLMVLNKLGELPIGSVYGGLSEASIDDPGFTHLYETIGRQCEEFEEEFDVLGIAERRYAECVWWGFRNAALELSYGSRIHDKPTVEWIYDKAYVTYLVLLAACNIEVKVGA